MRYLIFILAVMFFPTVSLAATTNLGNCEQATVNNAIASATTGDTLACPAGSWTWTDVNIMKNVTLQGAGIGSTIITLNAFGALESPSSYSGAFRVTGFTFRGGDSTGNGNWVNGIFRVFNGEGFRIDHNEFQIYSTNGSGTGGNGIEVRYNSAGLIDHNRFIVRSGSSTCFHYAVSYFNSGTSNTAQDAQEYGWLNNNTLNELNNATNMLVVEDNYFYNQYNCASHNSHAMYGGFGGHGIFRHNEIHNMNWDAHGMCASHSVRVFEVSNNSWIQDVGFGIYSIIHPRGGTGVIYGNTSTGSITYGIQWDLEDRSSSCSTIDTYVPGYGQASPKVSCANAEGWPCAEQIGRGLNQESDPAYAWNNSLPTTKIDDSTYNQSGRDFYTTGPKPGYIGYPYPHPLTGQPCIENCEGGQPPSPSPLTPNPPDIIQVQ